jgi:hypothetical protein
MTLLLYRGKASIALTYCHSVILSYFFSHRHKGRFICAGTRVSMSVTCG